MYYNKLVENRNLNGIPNFGLAGIEFQGRVTALAAPEKIVCRAAHEVGEPPLKKGFQGRVVPWPAPRN